jgi:hypothetical protein
MTVSNVTYEGNVSAPVSVVLANERKRHQQKIEYWLDVALEDSFPCSDPISSMRAD